MTEEARRTLKILKNNAYMTLATATKSGAPWISPLFYVHDRHNRLYWYSRKEAKHSRLLAKNDRVAITIFDSHANSDEADGLYISGKAREVTKRELIRILPSYAKKCFGNLADRVRYIKGLPDFLGKSPLRMYVAIPGKLWVLGPVKLYHGKYLDGRVEVY
jgi:uncharacterized protein YhbP (UPF0306 family)